MALRSRGQFPYGWSDFILAGMAVVGAGQFVGRVEELARLLGALEQDEQGRPALVLVSGDAGVGKTWLLVELTDRARRRGVRVLVGGCLEVGDVGLPFVPLIAALRGFAAEAGNDELLAAAVKGLPGLGRLLPELADQPAADAAPFDHNLAQLQLFDAVRTLLVHLSKDGLVVLVLEDLHWADASTRELVAFLHQTLRTGRVLVVASYRSDELHRRHPLWPWLAELGRRPGVERLMLGPLSQAELAEHLTKLHGARLSAAALERILARSEGNPFYAEELLAAGADHIEATLPAALAEVLLARVQGLSDAAQQVLRAAAVAGRQVGMGCWPTRLGSRSPTWSGGCGRRLPPTCWWRMPPPRVTPSATLCCRRRCMATCCPSSVFGCTLPMLGCWPRPPRLAVMAAMTSAWRCSLLNSPITAWPVMT